MESEINIKINNLVFKNKPVTINPRDVIRQTIIVIKL